MGCCQRLSTSYLVLINTLFAVFGCALMAFGVLGAQQRIEASILFPVNILKMLNILGIIIVFTAIIGIIGAFCRERQALHILYTTIVVIALIYQVSTSVIVYDQAAHTPTWLSQTWAEATQEYRSYAQTKFSCCGFSNARDHPVEMPTCQPDNVINAAPPCYHPLISFVQHDLQMAYIVLFTAISIEILALCNAITLLCARYVGNNSDEEMAGSQRRWVSKPSEVQPSEYPLDAVEKKQQHGMVDSAFSDYAQHRQY